MEDAWIPLLTDIVPGPAHERSVLQRPCRREGEDRARVVGVDKPLLHLFSLRRVVERPPEANLGRIGLHPAGDVSCLHLGHAVYFNSLRSAHRRDWNEKEGEVTEAKEAS